MDVPISKTDRKTLFLSFLDGRDQDMAELQQALEDSGLNDIYRIITTSKPLQAFGGEEAAQILENIAGEELSNVNQERWGKTRLALTHIESILARVDTQLMLHTTSDNLLGNSLGQLTSSLQQSLKDVNRYTHMHSGHDHMIQEERRKLSEVTPNEGEIW